MSQQAFWLFLKMDKRNLFVQMALQCAPVLAGIKVSNLLIIEERYWKELCFLLRNSEMCARKLYRCRDKITLLLYRREELEQWVKTLQVEALLKADRLRQRGAAPDFQKTGTADRRARKR